MDSFWGLAGFGLSIAIQIKHRIKVAKPGRIADRA
jgi:hypothetical protein